MMKHDFGPVWVIAEQSDCKVEVVSLQLLGKARELADELGVACETVLLGHNLGNAPRELIAVGADRVLVAEAAVLEFYQPTLYRDIIVSLAEEHQPEIILIGSTFMGRELAPLVAGRLKTGLAAHCIGLHYDQDRNLVQQIPAYGGLMSIVCPERRPQMATVARGVFQTPLADPAREGRIVSVPVPDGSDLPVKTLEIVREASSGLALEDARVIVSGGAGVGSREGWETVRSLAETIEAALGCTRPVVDEGWAPLESMIGQSGKMVSPEAYLGIGLSGEQQHMVGITGAKLMVAVNNDPKASVFQQVDLGIVENYEDFVPVLIAKIKAHREAGVTCR